MDVIISFTLCLIAPLIIFFSGLLLRLKKIDRNYLFGYRTSLSMKNDLTWKYANTNLGKIWSVYGAILLIISIVLCIYLYKKNEKLDSIYILLLIFLQLVFVIISIIFMEIKMNKKFDKEGNER